MFGALEEFVVVKLHADVFGESVQDTVEAAVGVELEGVEGGNVGVEFG